MKAGLYARVSKTDDSQNPENQLVHLRAYATEHSLEVYREYVDAASGADPHRPELKRLVKDARAHRFSIVLAVKYDRLARSVIQLETIVEELDRVGIKLNCIDEPIGTETPEGIAFRQMLGVMAQLERGLIRSRTKAALARAKAEGKRLGRPPKRIDMRRAHELRAQGLGYRKIARELGISRPTLWARLKKEGGESDRRDPSS